MKKNKKAKGAEKVCHKTKPYYKHCLEATQFKNKINQKHNTNWPEILDYPYRILVIGASISGKTGKLLNMIKQRNYDGYDIVDKHYLHVKKIQMKQNIDILFKKYEKIPKVWRFKGFYWIFK